MDILLGSNGSAVSSGGKKVPLRQGSQNPLIDWPEALEHFHVDNVSFHINRDFNHYVTASAREEIRLELRIDGNRGQGRPNLETTALPIEQRAKGRAFRNCRGGECSFRVVAGFDFCGRRRSWLNTSRPWRPG